MGLDSYLTVSIRRSDFIKDDADVALLATFNVPDGSVSVEHTVKYWRNAHTIHNWFVDHVQGGVDNCATYHVSVDDLENLKKDCEEALVASSAGEKDSANFLVEENDEWYIEKIGETLSVVSSAIEVCKANPEATFYYTSSW